MFVDDEFGRNRGYIDRAVRLGTDDIISGCFEGLIIASEVIDCDSLTMPLNWREGVFAGGLHTDPSEFGGCDHMMLSATRLRLHRDSTEARVEEQRS